MKNKAEFFKDLTRNTAGTTINIGNLTIKNISNTTNITNTNTGKLSNGGSFYQDPSSL